MKVRAHEVTGVLAWTGIVMIALGLVVSVFPVSNPGVQRCGAPIGFLVTGEFDRRPDAAGRILRDGRVVTLDEDAVRRAVETPCSERVERRAIPAGILVVGGSLMGLTAMTIGIVGAWRRAAARPRADTDQAVAP